MNNTKITLELPDWLSVFIKSYKGGYSSEEQRMRFVIKLAEMNVDNNTGGPFGAAVFEQDNNHLVAVGVNAVVSSNCSVAHAEILAIMLAQKALNVYNLGKKNSLFFELVTSCEPCAMCLGALTWSGIKRVVCGARDDDVRAIGFDEGPKPSGWIEALSYRGIQVHRDVCRFEAIKVLEHYKRIDGIIYNG